MARRIRFAVAQPIIIIGWYMSSGLLIGLLVAFRVATKTTISGRIYSQAYFYGAFAAGLYFIISSLLVVTVYGAEKGHYSREYKLTTSQRTLMLQTIIFFVYLLGGSAVYHKVEGWRFLEAVYFADYTLLTIGIGNFVPLTHLGRSLLFPYAVGGIVILGLVISSIRKLMLETGQQKMADVLESRTRRFLVREALSDHPRLPWLVPHLRRDEETSEREKRKQEFMVMRQVRQLVTVQHKWLSLVMSLTLWMSLWLFGAIVFWRAEAYSHWSYFEAVYFSYTTLLTIGYGDFFPHSSLGTSFFVFWTLLAVPSITILISNIGDTLIRFMRDITVFVGEITILPGDRPFTEHVKELLHTSWLEKWVQETTGEKPSTQDVSNGDEDKTRGEEDMHTAVEAEEHEKELSARRRGDIAAENIHHYNYLLFREVRKMMDYAVRDLSKEFDYLEWEYYLSLISGEQKPDVSGTGGADREDDMRDWSWIDQKSPLLGGKSEVEWLLGALTEALERELKRTSHAARKPASEAGRGHRVADEDSARDKKPKDE